MASKNKALAWGIGLATVAVAGLGIWYYETKAGNTASSGVSAQQFLASNDTTPSAAKPEVDKALTLAALNHATQGQAHATNAVAQGANAVEIQALQMAGYKVS